MNALRNFQSSLPFHGISKYIRSRFHQRPGGKSAQKQSAPLPNNESNALIDAKNEPQLLPEHLEPTLPETSKKNSASIIASTREKIQNIQEILQVSEFDLEQQKNPRGADELFLKAQQPLPDGPIRILPHHSQKASILFSFPDEKHYYECPLMSIQPKIAFDIRQALHQGEKIYVAPSRLFKEVLAQEMFVKKIRNGGEAWKYIVNDDGVVPIPPKNAGIELPSPTKSPTTNNTINNPPSLTSNHSRVDGAVKKIEKQIKSATQRPSR